jgi:hypothetical protein
VTDVQQLPEDIREIERLTKMSRRQPSFDKLTAWMAEFEETTLPHFRQVQEAESEMGPESGFLKALDSFHALSEAGLLSNSADAVVASLYNQADRLSNQVESCGLVIEKFQELEKHISELDTMFGSPRDYATEDKDQLWDEAMTSLGDIADALKSLRAEESKEDSA